ncbi:MAG: hypothetical protein HHJ12_01435 [Glaciimonas sp.]|nr:hypothetical protein [Glaciimonas sp.]
MTTITIDGKEYDADTLSDEARAQLISLQVTDQKIAEHQAQMAIYQTARAAYGRELLALLPAEAKPAEPATTGLKKKKK